MRKGDADMQYGDKITLRSLGLRERGFGTESYLLFGYTRCPMLCKTPMLVCTSLMKLICVIPALSDIHNFLHCNTLQESFCNDRNECFGRY